MATLTSPASIPAKIGFAVKDCLAVCLPAWLPVARLSLYLDELRNSGDWTDEEIFEVDARVRRFLVMLAQDESA